MTARARPAPSSDTDSAELLAEILTELRALRREVAELRARPPAVHAGDAEAGALLRAIVTAVGDHLFTAADLLLRVPPPADTAIRRAIVQAVGGASPRRIGKLLKRYEGLDVDGLRVIRVGVERDGIAWQIVASLRV